MPPKGSGRPLNDKSFDVNAEQLSSARKKMQSDWLGTSNQASRNANIAMDRRKGWAKNQGVLDKMMNSGTYAGKKTPLDE